MSLDKSNVAGREHRQPYRASKAIDGTCRNHGSCPWCQRSRTRKARLLAEQAQAEQREIVV